MAAAPSPVAGLISVLEADFRQLSHDARKSQGFASLFNSSDNQPEIKDAADRAVMKIRSLAEHPNALDQIRSSKASTHFYYFFQINTQTSSTSFENYLLCTHKHSNILPLLCAGVLETFASLL
jgi:hypothetical protein